MNQRDVQEVVFLRERLTLLDQLDEIALFGAGDVVFLAVEWTRSTGCFLLHAVVRSIMTRIELLPSFLPLFRSYYPYFPDTANALPVPFPGR